MSINKKDQAAALAIMKDLDDRMGDKKPSTIDGFSICMKIIDAMAAARLDAVEEFKRQKKNDLEAEGNFAMRDETEIAKCILDTMAKRTWTDAEAEKYLSAHLESFFAAGYAAATVRITGSCANMQMAEGSPFKGRIIDCRGDVPTVRIIEESESKA